MYLNPWLLLAIIIASVSFGMAVGIVLAALSKTASESPAQSPLILNNSQITVANYDLYETLREMFQNHCGMLYSEYLPLPIMEIRLLTVGQMAMPSIRLKRRKGD